jgi:hypothetical protein
MLNREVDDHACLASRRCAAHWLADPHLRIGQLFLRCCAVVPPEVGRLPLSQKDPHHASQASVLGGSTIGFEAPARGAALDDLAVLDRAPDQSCQRQ